MRKFGPSFFKLLLVTFTFVVITLFPTQGLAKSDRISRGVVEAVLHAFTTGGRVVLLRTSDTSGFHAAPAELFEGSIRPFPGSPWDGGRFCVDDWHVILIALFDGGDSSYKMKDAQERFSNVNITFTLDGEPLSTDRTSVKRFLKPESFGLDVAYGFQEGKILSPDELGVGIHKLNVIVSPPETFEGEIDFYVDPSDSTTCSQ